MSVKILALGPFIGSFEQEIMSFVPYARYLSHIMEYDHLYICGHSNRGFLYDWIDEGNHYHINEKWTRDDCKQTGYVHSDVISQQFLQTVKGFRQDIKARTNCLNKDIDLYNLPYIKSTPVYSTVQKIFEPTQPPTNKIKEKDYVVFIPDESISEESCLNIYNALKNEYNILIIGDCKTHLPEHNVIMQRLDYVEKVYELVYNYIHGAKFVITPCSYWTILCNIQGVPVFSWGQTPSVYKTEGTFGFDNKNMVMYGDDDINTDTLLRSIEYFEHRIRI